MRTHYMPDEYVAYMNGFGDILCDPEYELSIYQDQMGRGCGGPWKGLSQLLVNTWRNDMHATLLEEIMNDKTVTSGVDPTLWADLTAAVRCTVCGAQLSKEEYP